jgi:hypothetical protein
MTPEEKAVINAAITWRNDLDYGFTRIVGSPVDTLLHAVNRLTWQCDKCNYDRHTCPGCGTNISHGDGCCAECERL